MTKVEFAKFHGVGNDFLVVKATGLPRSLSKLATAILDRLLHHSTTINIRGESYRLKDRRRAGLLSRPEEQQSPTSLPPPSAGATTSRTKRSSSVWVF